MKKIFTLLYVCLFCLTAFSQNLPCGVPDESYESEMLRVARLAIIKEKLSLQRLTVDEVLYIPLKMHLFGENNNTGYLNVNDLNNQLAFINKEYRSVNIQFYFSGTTFNRYSDGDFYYYEMPSYERLAFQAANGVNNAINIYVSEEVYSGENNVAGYTYLSPSRQEYNVIWTTINSYSASNPRTLTHELGHYFSLPHTFNNSQNADITRRELVTRSFLEQPPRLSANCDTQGDFVCDTPSDPFVSNGHLADCYYAGTELDANGDLFTPAVNNYMSYYYCPHNFFTEGQKERIINGSLLVTNAEDFTLDAPETIQPEATNVVASTNPVYFDNVTVSWTDNSADETGYIIEMAATSQGPFVPIAGVGANVTSYIYTNVQSDSTYCFRVKPSNSKTTYSEVSNLVEVARLCGYSANGQACALSVNPVYAAFQIEDFVLERGGDIILDNSGSGCSENSLGNYFDAYSAGVSPGDIITFSIRSRMGNTGAFTYVKAKVYIDWNNNDDFTDQGEMVFESAQFSAFQIVSSFRVPDNFTEGSVRLRAMITGGLIPLSSPCRIFFGEMEDYKLTSTGLGVKSLTNQEMSVYPNPANTVINLKVNSVIDNVIIADVSGKKVMSLAGNQNVINIEAIAAGLYIITVRCNDKKYVQKFIKQ